MGICDLISSLQVSPAAAVFIHPTWKKSPTIGQGIDVALIKLACPLNLPTVALPEPGFDVAPGTELWVCGFGRSSPGSPYHSHLQHLLMPRQCNSDCAYLLNDAEDVPAHLLCSGQKTGSLCQGM